METIEKWMCVMVIVCPRLLEDEKVREQWRVLMSRRYALPLFRDFIEKLHDLMTKAVSSCSSLGKDYKRQLERDVKNSLTVAVNDA